MRKKEYEEKQRKRGPETKEIDGPVGIFLAIIYFCLLYLTCITFFQLKIFFIRGFMKLFSPKFFYTKTFCWCNDCNCNETKKTTGSNSASSRQPAQRDINYDELDRFFQDYIKQFTDWRFK